MNDILRMLENQAKWQRQRACLSWPEEIRMAVHMRDVMLHLRSCPPYQHRPDSVVVQPPPSKN